MADNSKKTLNHESSGTLICLKSLRRFVIFTICSTVTVYLQLCGLESSGLPSPSAISPAILHHVLSRKADMPQKYTLYVKKKSSKRPNMNSQRVTLPVYILSFSLQRSLGNNVSAQSSKK